MRLLGWCCGRFMSRSLQRSSASNLVCDHLTIFLYRYLINNPQSFPRARPRSIRHKLASDFVVMRLRQTLAWSTCSCHDCKPTIRKSIPINGLRHRTRILAGETPCIALLRITTQSLHDCCLGKRFRFPFSSMSKRAMDKPQTLLSQYLHFSSHLHIEPLVSRLVVLCFIRISLQRKNSIEIHRQSSLFRISQIEPRGRISCKCTVQFCPIGTFGRIPVVLQLLRWKRSRRCNYLGKSSPRNSI